VHYIPYTDHSSYDELNEFIKILKPKSIVITVKNPDSDTTIESLSGFERYLSREPIVDKSSRHRLVLQSLKNSQLNSVQLFENKHKKKTTMQQQQQVTNASRKSHIEYEDSPVKTQVEHDMSDLVRMPVFIKQEVLATIEAVCDQTSTPGCFLPLTPISSNATEGSQQQLKIDKIWKPINENVEELSESTDPLEMDEAEPMHSNGANYTAEDDRTKENVVQMQANEQEPSVLPNSADAKLIDTANDAANGNIVLVASLSGTCDIPMWDDDDTRLTYKSACSNPSEHELMIDTSDNSSLTSTSKTCINPCSKPKVDDAAVNEVEMQAECAPMRPDKSADSSQIDPKEKISPSGSSSAKSLVFFSKIMATENASGKCHVDGTRDSFSDVDSLVSSDTFFRFLSECFSYDRQKASDDLDKQIDKMMTI
jgi:hypothetical protein